MIDQRSLAILISAIHKYVDTTRYKAFVFGSRTGQNHRKYCDLDVGILGSSKVPVTALLQLEDELRNSDIPYRTDVVDFTTVSQDFREKALTRTIAL